MDFMGKNFFIENSHFYEVGYNASLSFLIKPRMNISCAAQVNRKKRDFIAKIKFFSHA